jgi:glycosyltransferase involved in cell wall biosynthesis
MKVAYLTNAAAENRKAWSGLSYYMRRSLESAGVEVEVIGSMLFPPVFWPERFAHLVAEKTGKAPKHIWTFEPRVIRNYTRQIERRLAKSDAQAVFGSGSMLLSQLKTTLPMYFWSDATFASMIDYYFVRGKITEATFVNGNELEESSISKSADCFYASQWAAESAVRDYKADPKKIHVVPLGANLLQEPTREEVEKWIDARPASPIRFFFIGVDWHRKGGDTTLALVEHLTKRGIRCELTIAGCNVPPEIILPPYVKTIGYINNTTEEGQALLREHFSEAHFLIVPSRAECFGLVFAEASAHGVPSLSAATGGIPTVVSDGVNGFCPPPGPDLVLELARHVIETITDRDKYRALALSSHDDYTARLNWRVNGLKIRSIMEQHTK